MRKNYGLSNTELELMELLWTSDVPLTFKEILDYCNGTLQKNWKKQTLSTYLNNMHKANLVSVDKNGKCYKYSPNFDKDILIQNWTKELIRDVYDNSISKLVMALTGGNKLSKEERDELEKLI